MELSDFITNPQAIEAKSMEIIEGLLAGQAWSEAERQVVKRVVHTTGDPEFAKLIKIHPLGVEAGIEAIQRGASIITDVEMVCSGVNKKNLAKAGGSVKCFLNDPQVPARAKEWGTTRTMAALRSHRDEIAGNIVAIGNAPTALIEIMRLNQEEGIRPALIVGCPVGFVGAAESKELLAAQAIPFVTVRGNKGGSNIAAAMVNAIIYLSVQREF